MNILRIISVVVLFLGSCSRHEKPVTTIRFWAFGNEGEMVTKLIPAFEREHPGIRVSVQQIPWTAAHEKLLTSYAGESTPDVSQLGNTWIPEFAVLEALEPLDQFVRGSGAFDMTDFFEGVLRTNTIDSTLYGIPWYVDTRVVYYRKDLVREAGYDSLPSTWTEVLRLCETMKNQARAKGFERYPIFFPTNEWVPAVIMGTQAGGEFLLDRNSRSGFSGEKFRKGLRLLNEFYRKEYSPVGQSLITNLYNSFSDGLITMYITGPWNVGEFQRRIHPSLKDDWMTAPLPSMDDRFPGASLPLGTSLVMFKGSEHKEEAWKLISFLTDRERSIQFFHITGNLPPRASAWQDSSLRSSRYLQTFYRQLQRVEPLPKVPEWEQIVIALQKYVEYVATHTYSVDEAMKRFDQDVDRMLEKRRWLLSREGTP